MNATQNDNNTARKENKWLADRSAGIFILLLSSGAAVITIVWPIMGMLRQSEDVIFSTYMIVITVLGFLFGLTYTILGGETMNKLGNPSDKAGTVRSIIFAVLFIAMVVGVMQIWESLINNLGYGA
jgi:hypothetical protein